MTTNPEVPWIASVLDWNAPTADDSRVTAEMVYALLSAKDMDSAKRAYQRLDGTICCSGTAFGAALPAVQLILAGLPSCAEPARLCCLDLLGEVIGGPPDDSDAEVVESCTAAAMGLSWYFLWGLQYDTVKAISLYTDVLCMLGLRYEDFRPVAVLYLRAAMMRRNLTEYDVSLIKNTLAELEGEQA